MTAEDERHLAAAIDVARQARDHGNHPFGAILVDGDGNAVLQAENTVITERDRTGHAEMNLIRTAIRRFEEPFLRECTVYASTEPCAMCAAAIHLAEVCRVVFALSSERFNRLAGGNPKSVAITCRELLGRAGGGTSVSGPHLEDEAEATHFGFWD